MLQYIERILEGKFEYDKGNLEFGCSKIELTLKCGEICEGMFTVDGAKNHLTQGRVYSSYSRMKVLNPEFIGNGETITYQFDATGMEEGDVVKGEFDIVSNQGEYYLPFVVTIEHEILQSSLEPVKNLFHFTNLAKTNWAEAVGLFYCKEFQQILEGNDRQYLGLYKGLSVYPGNEQNVEEFLIGIKKKQRIEYLLDDSSIRVNDPESMTQETIMITRNGWGYTHLKVEAQGAFIKLEKQELTDDDFLGNYCQLAFLVDPEKLHAGNNFGKICLSNPYFEKEVAVTVSHPQKERELLIRHRMKRQIIFQLMIYYQQFRLKKIGTATWLGETKKLVEKLEEVADRDLTTRLFETQLLITEERYNEAKWLLNRIADQMEGKEVAPEIACYYLYLTTLNSREESYVDEVAAHVEKIFERNPDNWRIAWLLLYLSDRYSRSSTKKWLFLEAQYNRGCVSPVLYIEAVLLLQINPALLTKMDDFETRVLGYAVKEGVLTEEVIRQTISIVSQAKQFHMLVFRILEACYKELEDPDVLQVICGYLIKGNCTGPGFFKWYRLGVEQNVRVTRLYEYYMLSMDLTVEEDIPKMVMMYFHFQNELDYERNARLYACILRKREEYPDIFASYQEQIEHFLMEQIDREHMNRDLVYLYKNLVTPQMIHEENADKFARMLFMNLVSTQYRGARYIVVLHAHVTEEYRYPLVNGVGMVPIFTGEYAVLFEDGEQNRLCASIDYNTEKMMIPGKLARFIAPYVKDAVGYDLFLCENNRSYIVLNNENMPSFLRIARDERIEQDYRCEVSIKLLQYLYDTDQIQELDELLELLIPDQMKERERSQLFRFLIMRGSFDKAYQWLKQFGSEQFDSKLLLKLCSGLISREDFQPEASMTYLAFQAFEAGKADQVTLSYLDHNYCGLTKKLRDLWKRSRDMGLDTRELEEKLLEQILYTGAYIGEKNEIFGSYIKKEPDEDLKKAFLVQSAYDYFVKERVVPVELFEHIAGMWGQQGEAPKVCKLAFTRFYAAKIPEDEQLQKVLKQFVEELLDEGIFLSYFKEYADLVPMSRHFYDRTIVEYQAHPDSTVTLHYVVEKEGEQEAEYVTEKLHPVFEGLCAREFILFFGETLQYYMMEERDGAEQLTESGTIRKSDIGKEVLESRFSRINDLVISQTLQDFDTLDSMMEEYYQTDYYADHLFRLQ